MKTGVAIITTVHPARDARIFHKQARTLARAGYGVTLLAPGAGKGVEDGVAFTTLPVPRTRFGRMLIGGIGALRAALRTRAEICHIHDPELLPAALALKALGRRVVYDAHEDYPEQILTKHYLPGWLRRTAARLAGFVEKRIAGRLDGIVCATDAVAAKFRKDRTAVVRNYPESAVSIGGTAGGERFRLVHFSGTLTPERGITSIVRTLGLLDDRHELVLGGRFVTPRYEALVRSLPGFRRVRYLGTIPHERVWDWYRRGDAGLVCLAPVPRYVVSLPVKMFEFMAAGLPVIVSDFPGLRQIVAGNRCGFCVDPESPAEIAAAVGWLARNREMAREMGENGRRAVAEKYNWHSEAQRLLALYRRLEIANWKSPIGKRWVADV